MCVFHHTKKQLLLEHGACHIALKQTVITSAECQQHHMHRTQPGLLTERPLSATSTAVQDCAGMSSHRLIARMRLGDGVDSAHLPLGARLHERRTRQRRARAAHLLQHAPLRAFQSAELHEPRELRRRVERRKSGEERIHVVHVHTAQSGAL